MMKMKTVAMEVDGEEGERNGETERRELDGEEGVRWKYTEKDAEEDDAVCYKRALPPRWAKKGHEQLADCALQGLVYS